MKMEKLDPPGTWCQNEAIRELIKLTNPKTFIEFGTGNGELSFLLCQLGLSGVGLELSDQAYDIARDKLRPFIESGHYKLIKSNALNFRTENEQFDLGISVMVMEHIQDDNEFLSNLKRAVKSNGHLIIGVPGRKDCWGVEDETVGHIRRYDREDLERLFALTDLVPIKIWSVAVPVANILLKVSNFLIARSTNEINKKQSSKMNQSLESGIREIPFKTVFPSFFKIILNRFTLFPLFLLQKCFYQSSFGLTLISLLKVKN